jgi:hypothetical protein
MASENGESRTRIWCLVLLGWLVAKPDDIWQLLDALIELPISGNQGEGKIQGEGHIEGIVEATAVSVKEAPWHLEGEDDNEQATLKRN